MQMNNPNLTDYVHVLCTLFERFVQAYPGYESQLYTYSNQRMIVLFTILQFRRIYKFKAQRRWLGEHGEMLALLGWATLPHRTTLLRRYKQLAAVLPAFVQFVGQYASQLDGRFRQKHLVADKSPFKAQGPVWHQADRQAGRLPAKLRNLDTEASWTKSGYHGWVYGYGLHITCNDAAFPALVQVATGSVAETAVIDSQEAVILHQLHPETLAADNSYAQARRIRRFAHAGVVLLSPAYKWRKGRFAQAYHRYRQLEANAIRLRHRRTTIEPLFDLVAKVIGTTARQKQLPVQGSANVNTCLALATLSVQLAMIVNSIWGLPLRNISTIAAALS
jgi:hypothetical protein